MGLSPGRARALLYEALVKHDSSLYRIGLIAPGSGTPWYRLQLGAMVSHWASRETARAASCSHHVSHPIASCLQFDYGITLSHLGIAFSHLGSSLAMAVTSLPICCGCLRRSLYSWHHPRCSVSCQQTLGRSP